jgi:hypothetical protein
MNEIVPVFNFIEFVHKTKRFLSVEDFSDLRLEGFETENRSAE